MKSLDFLGQPLVHSFSVMNKIWNFFKHCKSQTPLFKRPKGLRTWRLCARRNRWVEDPINEDGTLDEGMWTHPVELTDKNDITSDITFPDVSTDIFLRTESSTLPTMPCNILDFIQDPLGDFSDDSGASKTVSNHALEFEETVWVQTAHPLERIKYTGPCMLMDVDGKLSLVPSEEMEMDAGNIHVHGVKGRYTGICHYVRGVGLVAKQGD